MNPTYTYRNIESFLDDKTHQELLAVYDSLFNDADLEFFTNRLQSKTDQILNLCYKDEKLVGFKIGYNYNDRTFYSWIGGVVASERNKGIGQKLMILQHEIAKQKGYQKIRTKSMNRFKSMIILNLKNGFNIVQVYTNDSGQTKIVFEKNLI